jgi:hypothetical protein
VNTPSRRNASALCFFGVRSRSSGIAHAPPKPSGLPARVAQAPRDARRRGRVGGRALKNNAHVGVYWPQDGFLYPAIINSFNQRRGVHFIYYMNGERESLNLDAVFWRSIPTRKTAPCAGKAWGESYGSTKSPPRPNGDSESSVASRVVLFTSDSASYSELPAEVTRHTL